MYRICACTFHRRRVLLIDFLYILMLLSDSDTIIFV